MANPSVTYTFVNSTTADGTQVNQNFNDLISALTDNTKSLAIDALDVNGAATFDAAVTLGNGTSDDITVTGSLASSIPIKTNNSFDIGSATLGLAGIYFGAPSSRSTRWTSNQSIASSFTLVSPISVGSAAQLMRTDGSGNLSFVHPSPLPANYSLASSVAANAMTIALKGTSGSDASATAPIDIPFRSATAATGTVTWRQVTGALSIDITSTATLGHSDGVVGYIYVYAIDNAGTVELAVSGEKLFESGSRVTTTAMTAGSDSSNVLYSTTARTTVGAAFLGRIESTQATAGTWATAASEIAAVQGIVPIVSDMITFTPTGSWTTNTTYTGKYRRIGGHAEFDIKIALSGAPDATALTVNLPSGIVIDTARMTVSNAVVAVGSGTLHDDGTNNYSSIAATFDGSTTTLVNVAQTAVSGTLLALASITNTSPITFANNDFIQVRFNIPVVGWSATR